MHGAESAQCLADKPRAPKAAVSFIDLLAGAGVSWRQTVPFAASSQVLPLSPKPTLLCGKITHEWGDVARDQPELGLD
jgi:hypothetical protein